MAGGNTEEAFILQADGSIHASDVRFVSPSPLDSNSLFSASRDNTAKWVTIPKSGDALQDYLTFIGHTAFVNFVLYHPGIELLDNEPCIVTGSNDHHLVLWNLETSAVEAVLDGHNSGTCCGAILSFTPGSVSEEVTQAVAGDIVSGDWGGMVIVFDHKSGRPKQVYDKHATAIRGVAQLTDTSKIVSCSGDKTIHAWDAVTGATIQIFSGHKDVVQCICTVDSERFASAGNDCSIRLWRLGAESPLQILEGHDSLIYSVCWSPAASELYSASEDHTVRVWRAVSGNDMLSTVQVVQHPCLVWSVAYLPDGKLVTGGSDHTVRVWTRDYDHMASIDKLEALEAAVSSQTVDVKIAQSSGAAAAGGGLDVESMPYTHEIARRRGAQEGERLFARNEKGEVELHVWNTGRWEKIGVVVAGPEAQSYTGAESQRRETHFYNGESYDYLFDVDVEGRMLKLPYRVGDSLVEAAKRFIQDHRGVVTEDSQEEIQNFLMSHVSAEDLARVPGLEGWNTATAPSASAAPPPLPPAATSGVPGGASDSPAPPPSAETLLTPWTAPQTFDSFNATAAQKKVNTLLSDNSAFQKTVVQLTAPLQEPLTLCIDLVALYKALPLGDRFPALDALRYLLIVTPNTPAAVEGVLSGLASVWDPQQPAEQRLPPTSANEYMTALRLTACILARLCDGRVPMAAMPAPAQATLAWLVSRLPAMTGLLTPATTPATRTHCKTATAAILRNASVLLSSAAAATVLPPELAETLALAVAQQSALLFVSERNDAPVVADCLCSLRTLLLATPSSSPAWRGAVVAQMQKLLGFSLRSIATGALVRGQSTAEWILREIGIPILV